jgi:hypothetical protein
VIVKKRGRRRRKERGRSGWNEGEERGERVRRMKRRERENEGRKGEIGGRVRRKGRGREGEKRAQVISPSLRNTNQGILKCRKYHCTVDLLFDWFGISCMTTDNFLFLFAKQTNPNQSNRRSTVQRYFPH